MPLIIFQHVPSETAGRLGIILRDSGFRIQVVKPDAGEPLPPDLDEVEGVISLGGPMNVDQGDKYPWLRLEMEFLKKAHDREIPIVGICLGAQMIATVLGGEVGQMDSPELGWGGVKSGFPGTIDPLFAGVPWDTQQFHLHEQEVKKLPDGATPLSGSKACKTQAFKVGQSTYGFQYHFEWTPGQMQQIVQENAGMFEQVGMDTASLAEQTKQLYPMYEHLGNRLANNMAMLLFPTDKYVWARPCEPVANFQPERS